MKHHSQFQFFKEDISNISLPEKFTFPFSYQPHELAKIAMKEIQEYLESQSDFSHPFFHTEEAQTAIGKMFGVLVVQTSEGKVGYLAAFSGKLANQNHVSFFVPPVFDMLKEKSFFVEEEILLNDLNAQLDKALHSQEYTRLQEAKLICEKEAQIAIETKKQDIKELKNIRKHQRVVWSTSLSDQDYEIAEKDLIRQSLRDKHELHVLKNYWNVQIETLQKAIASHEETITDLKELRKKQSSSLQRKLFQNYAFLNANGESKNLLSIFQTHTYPQPPAGAGECCAPKLLQYAYLKNLKPLCMAEFWWGSSPKSEVRLHRQFYPSCWGKCEPILSHMLQGLPVEDNPLLNNPAQGKSLEILYEDPYFLVLNKPSDFLSVPGIHIQDSVYTRMKNRFPNASGPLIVHRLDMATSGVMVIAKTKEIHKQLQSQFIKRIVKKRYVAKLNGHVSSERGSIELPLRVDLEDRPRQLVCFQYGKFAKTEYQVFRTDATYTWVYFYPITGRTHQLRVHAAHQNGLHCSILGDDLYGSPSDRLYLHAQQLIFMHPVTREWVTFESDPEF